MLYRILIESVSDLRSKFNMQEFEAYVTHHSDKKKSVGNINKKFSLCFSLNIFHRDF